MDVQTFARASRSAVHHIVDTGGHDCGVTERHVQTRSGGASADWSHVTCRACLAARDAGGASPTPKTRIRRKARLHRMVGRCGEAVASVDWQPAPDVQEAFLRARMSLTGLALELGHDLADVRAGLDGAR